MDKETELTLINKIYESILDIRIFFNVIDKNGEDTKNIWAVFPADSAVNPFELKNVETPEEFVSMYATAFEIEEFSLSAGAWYALKSRLVETKTFWIDNLSNDKKLISRFIHSVPEGYKECERNKIVNKAAVIEDAYLFTGAIPEKDYNIHDCFKLAVV